MLKEYLSAHGIEAVEKTNADRIRGMTDEELLDLMCLIACESGCPPGDGETTCKYDRCVDCWGAWLRQPVEVADG